METDSFLQRFEKRRAAREAAERSFQIAGVTLTYRPTVAPEVGIKLAEMRQQVLNERVKLQEESEKIDKAREANGGDDIDMSGLVAALDAMTPDVDIIQIGDETVIACLTDEGRQEWAKLRSNDAEQPLTFEEVFEIADYLLGRVAGIPTSAPADSSAGRTETGKRSKDKSSSAATAPTT